MAKKEKVVELKPKAEKISEEHLKELQDLVNGMNGFHFKIGRLESEKHATLHDLAVAQNKITLMQDTLTKEYGTYDVNVQDGTINWPKNEK
jgi:hypothetical protein